MEHKKLADMPPAMAAKVSAETAERLRQRWAECDRIGSGTRDEQATRVEAQDTIRESVAKLWEEAKAAERAKDMSGNRGSQEPTWDWGKQHYVGIMVIHEDQICRYCGSTTNELDVYHLDENDDNYLLTNLVWMCSACYAWRFGSARKTMFVTLSKMFDFEYSHILPWHPGKCARLHGHSGRLEVLVRGRTDPNGIVMDYYDLSQLVKMAIVEKLDHHFVNDYVPNPTSENMLWWIWQRLEDAGLKGLVQLRFSETASSWASITDKDVYEAFGWSLSDGTWQFVPKLTADA